MQRALNKIIQRLGSRRGPERADAQEIVRRGDIRQGKGICKAVADAAGSLVPVGVGGQHANAAAKQRKQGAPLRHCIVYAFYRGENERMMRDDQPGAKPERFLRHILG